MVVEIEIQVLRTDGALDKYPANDGAVWKSYDDGQLAFFRGSQMVALYAAGSWVRVARTAAP